MTKIKITPEINFKYSKAQRAAKTFIEELYSADLISPSAKHNTLEKTLPKREWETWTARLLVLVGSSLFLAGVVFFFAFNWSYITPFWKLAIVQGGIILGVIGALYFSLETIIGKISALSAGLMVGVFLAVFGQIYQTGANAYSLFVPWMLLILPWVILTRFSALWFMWFVVSQLALSTYWLQGVLPGTNLYLLIFTLTAISGCLFILLHEGLFKGGDEFHDVKWVRILTVFYVLGMISGPLMWMIFDFSTANIGALVGGLSALILFSGFYYVFRWRMVDKIALSGTVAAISVAIGAFASKLIFNNGGSFEFTGLYLLIAIIYLGITGLAITHLRNAFKTMEVSDG